MVGLKKRTFVPLTQLLRSGKERAESMLRTEIQPTMPSLARLLLFIPENCALAFALMTALTPLWR
jgi:hypothetical protein